MRLLALVGVTALLAGCNSADADGAGAFAAAEVHVALGPDGVEIAVGDTVRMRAFTVPPRSDATFTWATSPLERATITDQGLLTAHRPGEIAVQACTVERPKACNTVPIYIK